MDGTTLPSVPCISGLFVEHEVSTDDLDHIGIPFLGLFDEGGGGPLVVLFHILLLGSVAQPMYAVGWWPDYFSWLRPAEAEAPEPRC